jgi:hypothetical protein
VVLRHGQTVDALLTSSNAFLVIIDGSIGSDLKGQPSLFGWMMGQQEVIRGPNLLAPRGCKSIDVMLK